MQEVINSAEQNMNKSRVSISERRSLGHNISFLNKNDLKGMLKIIGVEGGDQGTNTVEVDLEHMSDDLCRQLIAYVKDCLTKKVKKPSS